MPASAPKLIRVLLIADEAIVLGGLRRLIEKRPVLRIVGEGASFTEAFSGAHEPPDLILVDLDFSRERSPEFLPKLLKGAGEARVLMLTTARNFAGHQPVLRFGAMSVLFKEKPFQALVDSIEEAHRGEIWLDRSLMADVLRELSSAKGPKQIEDEARKIAVLTKREREVIELIANGAKIKEVADHLLISGNSVHQHLRSIFSKLGLSDRFELALYARLHDLARPAICAPPLPFLDVTTARPIRLARWGRA